MRDSSCCKTCALLPRHVPRHVPCYPNMCPATQTWALLPRHGHCYPNMGPATQTWALLPKHVSCYPDMCHATCYPAFPATPKMPASPHPRRTLPHFPQLKLAFFIFDLNSDNAVRPSRQQRGVVADRSVAVSMVVRAGRSAGQIHRTWISPLPYPRYQLGTSSHLVCS